MGEDTDLARRALDAGLLGADGDGETPPVPDRYELGRLLGRGGAGAVYLARDTSLQRPVALKFLRGTRAAEVERFLREARFTARLHHPAIVQVFDAGECEGAPYIAMQYIDGGNLATVKLTLVETVQALRRVADALAHVHKEGIVHRDIKPENILLDGARRAFVTDFGIARDLHGDLGATISRDGQIMGTPALMPPEQARGDLASVDARSDIYTLGATFFHKVTGRWPFEADNVVDMLHAVMHKPPLLPRSLNPDLPRELETCILRCLAKKRAERYPSMESLVAAFDAFLEKRAEGRVSPVWFANYVRKLVDGTPEEAVASGPTTDGDLGEALDIVRELDAWDLHLYRLRSNLPRVFPALDRIAERADEALAENPACGWARFYRGMARFRRGDLGAALEDMERAVDRVRDPARAYAELGRLYLALHARDERTARRHLSPVATDEDLQSARSRLDQAAVAFAEAARHDRAEEARAFAEAVRKLAEGDARGAVAACEALLATDPDREEVWKLQATALRELGEDPEACYEKALAIRRSDVELWLLRADRALAAGDAAAATAHAEEALDIVPGHPAATVLLARAALAEGGAGARARGLELAAQAAERAPDSYDAAVVLAELQIADGQIANALAHLARAATLGGCCNRVHLLTARARLARAQRTRAEGGDPAADLRAVLDLPADPQSDTWNDVRTQAERELRRSSRD